MGGISHQDGERKVDDSQSQKFSRGPGGQMCHLGVVFFLEAEEKLPAGKQENNAGCVESYGKPGQPPGGDGQPERR